MYCSKCGKQVSDEDKFCQICGAKIRDSKITKTDKIKNEQINSFKKNGNKKNIIIGVTICIVLALSISIIYFKFIIKAESTNTHQSEDIALQDNTGDNIQTTSEEAPDTTKTLNITKDVHKEKEVFAKLLKSTKWLAENTDYEKSPNSIKFTVVDINQDGVYEMLLYHGDSGGLAGLTLSIVSYNINEDKINAQKINVSHGGYVGYFSNEKTIVTDAMLFGVSYMGGYKLQGERYIQTFSTSDNTDGIGSDTKIIYTLNENDVSKEDYHKFIDPIKSNLTCTEMYSINDENIKNVLGVDLNTVTEDDSIERYFTLKFKVAEQAKEWLLAQDSIFIENNKLSSIKESKDYELVKMFFQYYAFEKDDYYLFEARYDEFDTGEPIRYLVGEHTGNVYQVGIESGGYAYLIKNNQVIEKLKYNDEESNDWRKLRS